MLPSPFARLVFLPLARRATLVMRASSQPSGSPAPGRWRRRRGIYLPWAQLALLAPALDLGARDQVHPRAKHLSLHQSMLQAVLDSPQRHVQEPSSLARGEVLALLLRHADIIAIAAPTRNTLSHAGGRRQRLLVSGRARGACGGGDKGARPEPAAVRSLCRASLSFRAPLSYHGGVGWPAAPPGTLAAGVT